MFILRITQGLIKLWCDYGWRKKWDGRVFVFTITKWSQSAIVFSHIIYKKLWIVQGAENTNHNTEAIHTVHNHSAKQSWIKSESLILLLIMKMNRHLLHGACTSQNKFSNINNTPSLMLITHNNLQTKSSKYIAKKKKEKKPITHPNPCNMYTPVSPLIYCPLKVFVPIHTLLWLHLNNHFSPVFLLWQWGDTADRPLQWS